MNEREKSHFGRQPIHPFPARMAPGVGLKAMSRRGLRLRVLDPMMGSGTVLVTARATGHYTIGLDIDPLAVLISKVWASAIDKRAVRKSAEHVLDRARRDFYKLALGDAYPNNADDETRRFIRYWFDPCARRQHACLANAIRRYRDKRTRAVLWCCFSRLIITKQAGASRALDLAHSRPHRRFDVAPVKPFANFLCVVDQVLKRCLDSTEPNRGPAPRIRLGDARQLPLLDSSIDLVLTSPPYLNAIDYLGCSRFSLVWMGHNAVDLRRVRSVSIGSEVGDYSGAQNRLIAKLEAGANVPPRLHALLSRFIVDMEQAIKEVSRVLVPGGRAVYVIGENTINGFYIENARIITALARKAGLRLIRRTSRRLPPNRRYLPPPEHRRRGTALSLRMRSEVILPFVKAARGAARI
jgi:DNA modification methylase